ncbi:hypothetical protein EDB80DRAFT_733936 [Ilyonectria destructans]|nr:hypothetical protein EDB80DRAFT_733936 [Ilyonectria destructans]
MNGVFPLAFSLDTIGLLCRDVDILHKVTAAWLSGKSCSEEYNVTKITVLSDFEYGLGHAECLFDKFVLCLEEATDVKSTRINLSDNWKEANPSNEAEESTADEQKAALERREVFKAWFLGSVLAAGVSEELTTIIVAPISDEGPKYRDEYKESPWMGGNGFHRNFISSLTGCPEVVVPIGQIPYTSRVTKRQEFLPIVVATLGPHGTDIALTKFVVDVLRKSGMQTSVSTGTEAFPQTGEAC